MLRRDPQRACVEHEVAVGLHIDHEALLFAVGQRDAERDADLRGRAQRLARVAVRLVEVPELARPVLERARRQHPILALDRVPHFGGEARKRDRARIPILFRLLGPFRAARLGLRGDFRDARLYPRGEFLVLRDARLHQRGEHRDGERRIRHHAQVGVIHALVVERPAGELEVAEADLDPFRARRNHRRELARGAHELGRGLLPIARVQADHEVRVAEVILGEARVERMAAREVEPSVDVVDRDSRRLRELDERVERFVVASHVFRDDDRMRGSRDHIGRLLERCRIGAEARRNFHGMGRRQLHLVLELLLLQPRVVDHVHRALRLRHHHAVGARERLGHAIDRVRLVIPLRVLAHRLALPLRGVNPVDPRAALRLVHGARRADDEYRRPVDVGVVDRHVRVQQPDEVVQDRDHGLAARLGVAVRDLHRRLLVLAEHHRRAVLPVVDDRVVQAAIARAGIERGVRQVVGVQQVDDDVGRPTIFCGTHRIFRRPRRGLDRGFGVLFLHCLHAAFRATHFSGGSCT